MRVCRRKRTGVKTENHKRRVGHIEVLQRQKHCGVPAGGQDGHFERWCGAIRRGGLIRGANEQDN